jgi:tellurite resistance protein TehA-like permease
MKLSIILYFLLTLIGPLWLLIHLSTHIWISTKRKDEKSYIVYQVIGWRKLSGLAPLSIQADIPDRSWFGQKPTIIYNLCGELTFRATLPKILNFSRCLKPVN